MHRKEVHSLDVKYKIMIVDDEQDVLNALKRVFRRPPYEAHVFDRAQSALDVINDLKPDLIISDMRMPEMDGAQFLKKAKEARPMAPRILLTGHADKHETIRAINDGEIFGFVAKPWNNDELMSLVEDGLSKRHQEQLKNRALHTLKRMHDDVSEDKQNVEQKLSEESKEKERCSQALDDAYALMEESFLNLLDMKQPGQRAFVHQLEEVVVKLSEKLGLGLEERHLLLQASRLHGIGKIGIADETLNKPYEQMTDDEKSSYHMYPTSSACTLIAIEAFSETTDLLFKQKEHMDGTGFPNGLKKEDLSRLNTVFNVALDYSEMRYLPGIVAASHEQAVKKMQEHARWYAPEVLKALVNISLERDLVDKTSQAKTIAVHGLEEGMIVRDDIYSKNNILLLRGGAPVTEGLIDKLANLQKQVGAPIMVNVIIRSENH